MHNASGEKKHSTYSITVSRNVKIAVFVVGALLISFVSFAGGIAVGLKKAKFSYRWGENYERNFIGPPPPGPPGFFREFEGRDFRNAHGLAGTILSIADGKLIVKDRDDKETTIAITEKAVIKKGRDTLEPGALKEGDRIVVIGNPGENGAVNADLVRVFDDKQEKN